ncbi:hypothetical protein SLA2020_011070 [Shorea laevis]
MESIEVIKAEAVTVWYGSMDLKQKLASTGHLQILIKLWDFFMGIPKNDVCQARSIESLPEDAVGGRSPGSGGGTKGGRSRFRFGLLGEPSGSIPDGVRSEN